MMLRALLDGRGASLRCEKDMVMNPEEHHAGNDQVTNAENIHHKCN